MFAQRTVSLLFKPGWIEAVELQGGWGGKLMLTKSGRFPLLSQEPEQVIQAIHGALQAARIRTREVVLGLPSSEVLLRHFTLPAMPKTEWRQAVQFEARKYIPFKIDDLIWNFHAVEQPPSKLLQVVFVGAQQVTVAHYVSLLAQAGLKPVTIESPSVGLARMMLRGQPGLGSETVAVTEVSGEMAHILLVKEGVPYFARDVSLAGRDAAKPVEDFVSQAVASPAITAGAGKGDDRLELLISELHYSFNYFLREFPEDRVSRVFLCGEPVADEWLETLTKELRVSVERTPMAFKTRAGGQAVPAAAWAVAAGLAMPAIPKKEVAIPLDWRTPRPERQAVRQQHENLRQLLVKEVAAAACLLAVLAFLMHQRVAAVQRRVAMEQQGRSPGASTLGALSVADLQTQVVKAGERVELMRRLVEERVLMTPKLEAIARLMPEGTWLHSLTYETQESQVATTTGRSLGLHGYCFLGDKQRELSSVTGMTQRFKDTPELYRGFTAAALASVRDETLQQYKVTSFDVQCTFGGDRAAY